MKRICSKLNLKSRQSGIDMRFKKIEGTAMSIRYRSWKRKLLIHFQILSQWVPLIRLRLTSKSNCHPLICQKPNQILQPRRLVRLGWGLRWKNSVTFIPQTWVQSGIVLRFNYSIRIVGKYSRMPWTVIKVFSSKVKKIGNNTSKKDRNSFKTSKENIKRNKKEEELPEWVTVMRFYNKHKKK